MGHLHTDIVIRGNKAQTELKNVLIDTGATYTVLPESTLREIGASRIPGESEVELGNGKKVKAKAYGLRIKIKDAEAPCIAITFEGAKTVIGIETLESIGLRLDPTTGNLEFSRPKGLAYFYYLPLEQAILMGIIGIGGSYFLFKVLPKLLLPHPTTKLGRPAEKKKIQLLSSGNYKYVENFVKKYKNGYYDSEGLNKLKDLIAKKGTLFDNEEMIWLIDEETKIQNYEEFKTKVLYHKPKSLEEHITNFIEVYGDNYYEYLSDFENLLKEMKLHFSEEQLSDKIQQIKKEMELSYFEEKLSFDQLPSVSIHDIDLITGHEFERFLKTLFAKMGYAVEHTKLSRDQGADLVISKFGEKVVIQAKRQCSKVNNKAIQQAVAAIKHYGADRGMVVTTSEFTRSAVELANSNSIDLVDRSALEKLIRKYS
jgi:HJR/Mrr/RecB family endonuclease/predicted aspartyl protease